MIDLGAVERAVIAKLAGDAVLAALLPDGVYWDLAPEGSTRFVIVSLSTSHGLAELHDGDTLRVLTLVVKGVAQGPDSDPIVAADARIHALLDHGDLDLPPDAGCTLMALQWIERVRYTERIGAAVTWQHRGARFAVTVTPL